MRIPSFLAAAAVAVLAVPAAEAAPAPTAAPSSLLLSAVAGSGELGVSVSDQRRQRARRGYSNRRAHWRRVCTTKWRNHHRVRSCRRVRTWR